MSTRYVEIRRRRAGGSRAARSPNDFFNGPLAETTLIDLGTPGLPGMEVAPMLRWLFLVSGIAALAIMLAVGSQLTVFLAFGLMFANFATMCVQFDGPIDRARARMKAKLIALQPNSDAHQRMETATIKATSADHRHPMNMMTVLNLATGIACFAMFAWGLVLWTT